MVDITGYTEGAENYCFFGGCDPKKDKNEVPVKVVNDISQAKHFDIIELYDETTNKSFFVLKKDLVKWIKKHDIVCEDYSKLASVLDNYFSKNRDFSIQSRVISSSTRLEKSININGKTVYFYETKEEVTLGDRIKRSVKTVSLDESLKSGSSEEKKVYYENRSYEIEYKKFQKNFLVKVCGQRGAEVVEIFEDGKKTSQTIDQGILALNRSLKPSSMYILQGISCVHEAIKTKDRNTSFVSLGFQRHYDFFQSIFR